MADAVISALLDQLASITRERVEKKVSLVMGVDDEVENLDQNLQAIRMVLMDAEKRQLKDEAVKLWLDELKDVSYDMDSTLDEWITTILKSEIQQGANRSAESGTSSSADKITKRKVWFSVLFSCFHSSKLISPQAISHRLEVANEIKSLNEKLDKITIRKDRFKFRRTSSDIVERLKRPDTTSFLDVPVVYGQDNNKKILIDRLMLSGSSSQEGKELKIISIVGMGGIGKTTLAKNVYHDDEVKACFGGGQRIWVCVSEPFDIIKIAKEIIEQLNGEAPSVVGLEALMKKFHESIEGKKFLLVLDDVWTTRYNEWAPLEQVLRFGAAGSRVVVTTRNEKVAKMMGDMDMIRLNKLSEEDCWLLLSEIAFFGKTEQEREDFEEIGRKIARKCNGLPLAAKTLGSLLRVKETDEWLGILQSDIWDLENVKEELFYPLLLSYYDMHPLERRCFTYCAIFPKDFEFEKDDLIQQWIAQGYFKPKDNDEEVELTGQNCFQNLARRSFFQEFKYKHWDFHSTIKCKMHDIVHDFAQFLTLNDSTVSVFDSKKRVDVNARHLSLIISPVIDDVPAISLSNKTVLHSLMVLNNSFGTFIFPNQFLDLTRLRTLSLSEQSLQLPTNIGDLIHLRYLSFSNMTFKTITVPPSIGNLFNLQTLRLLYEVIELPEEVGKLINLRHLQASYGEDLIWPKSIGKLRSLRTLKTILISPNSQNFPLRDHQNLNCLRDINLEGLGTEEHLEEAKEAQLHNKTSLVNLSLFFNGDDTKMETHETLLETLRPHESLKCLVIARYCGLSISPSWMMSLIHLRKLSLRNSDNYEMLPPLGKLPCLESLDIVQSNSLKKMGPEFLGLEIDDNNINSSLTSGTFFPKLKRLNIQYMMSLCQWVGSRGGR